MNINCSTNLCREFLSRTIKSRVPVRYVAHLHLLRIASNYYADPGRKCRSILVDGSAEKRKKPNEKKKNTATRARGRKMVRGVCGARARDRKAGGKTAHAPSSSTWRITCCPLLKPPCFHLSPLLLLRVSVLVLSSASHSIAFNSAQPFSALSFPHEPSRFPPFCGRYCSS